MRRVVQADMLQSFRGTIDAHGIRTLRLEKDEEFERRLDDSVAEFWAVLNRRELPEIRRAFESGNRQLALRLLSDRATSMGSILPI